MKCKFTYLHVQFRLGYSDGRFAFSKYGCLNSYERKKNKFCAPYRTLKTHLCGFAII